MITLEFSNRYGLLGLLVRAWTGCWASHVDIVLDDGQLLGSAPDGGVKVRPFGRPRRVERYTFDISDQALAWALAQVGRPYDWLGCLGLALNWRLDGKRALFCSEFVALMALEGGVQLVDKNARWITPKHLLQSPHLTRQLGAPA